MSAPELHPVLLFTDGSHTTGDTAAGWGAVIRWKGRAWRLGGSMRSTGSANAEFVAIEKALMAVPLGHPCILFTDDGALVERHWQRFWYGRQVALVRMRRHHPDIAAAHRLANKARKALLAQGVHA